MPPESMFDRFERVDRALYLLALSVAQTPTSSKSIAAALKRMLLDADAGSRDYEAASYAQSTLVGVMKLLETKGVGRVKARRKAKD